MSFLPKTVNCNSCKSSADGRRKLRCYCNTTRQLLVLCCNLKIAVYCLFSFWSLLLLLLLLLLLVLVLTSVQFRFASDQKVHDLEK